MLDGWIRPYIDPSLNQAAGALARAEVTPNALTSVGLIFAGLCFAALTAQFYTVALLFMLLNRLCDGLDGPVARHPDYRARLPQDGRKERGFGAFYDILSDFILYAGMPFFFALGVHLAEENVWMPTAFLLMGIVLSAVGFLAYAVIAEKNRLTTTQQGHKGFYYMVGLMEGTETILFFAGMMLFPSVYPVLCWVFGGLCIITALARLDVARVNFGLSAKP